MANDLADGRLTQGSGPRGVILPFQARVRHSGGCETPHTREIGVADAWTGDVYRLRQVDGTPIARRARGAASRRTPPARAAVVLERYCEHVLEIGAGMTHVELLHIAYWIERLTVALTRAQRWTDALRWLDRFAQLPARYTQEITATQRERLARRRRRCRRVLGEEER
jgi:hypothetical protein